MLDQTPTPAQQHQRRLTILGRALLVLLLGQGVLTFFSWLKLVSLGSLRNALLSSVLMVLMSLYYRYWGWYNRTFKSASPLYQPATFAQRINLTIGLLVAIGAGLAFIFDVPTWSVGLLAGVAIGLFLSDMLTRGIAAALLVQQPPNNALQRTGRRSLFAKRASRPPRR